MIFYYIKAANNAMFGEKTVPGTQTRTWKNVYEGIHKMHGNTELLSSTFRTAQTFSVMF